ncbi:MAG: PD-(D/E)XK nuclease family transposase, partial [Bacilli bacterium]|nr:PD-(D/E)XK nuclease family transposase [Bacilli bacterium]
MNNETKPKAAPWTPEELAIRKAKAERWLKEACLMDNAAAVYALENDLEAAREMLVPVLGDPGITLTEVRTDVTVEPARKGSRRVTFDAEALDHDGNAFDVEVQMCDGYFSLERAVYYACALAHRRSLLEGEPFERFRRVVVIFFNDGDFARTGRPVTRILPSHRRGFGRTEDLGHLVTAYVCNVRAKGAKGELGRLFRDLRERDPRMISSPGLAKALGRVKNMAMEQDNIQWLLDNMSLERQERYHKSIEDAHRKGVEE